MTPVRTVARAMLGAMFLVGGADAVRDPDSLVPRAKPVTDRIAPWVARLKLPVDPETKSFVRANGVVQVAGALLLPTRWHRAAAVVLAATLVPTTLAGHAFWDADDGATRGQQRTHFLKNAGLMGGLILTALDNDGRPGLRWRAAHLRREAARAGRRTRSKARIAVTSARLGQHLPEWTARR